MKTLKIGVLIFVLMSGYLNVNGSERIRLTLDASSEVLVKASIAPIAYAGSNFHLQWAPLMNLRAVDEEKRHSVSVFQDFLPPKRVLFGNRPVAVGDIWKIKQQDGVLALLKQLQPNPDMEMGGVDSPGAWACLRAYSEQFAEIVFRVHAEFILEGGSLTPSQFAGKLVISRRAGKIAFFRMRVPEGTLNFDAKRYHKTGNSFGTDSGFLPRMELLAGTKNDETIYDVHIPEEEVERKLRDKFYKFQKINWVKVDEALELARKRQKPIHVISIDGPLTDESC